MTYIRPDKLRREKKIIRGTQPVTLTEKPNLKDYDDPWTDLSYEEVIERGHLIADLTLLERMEIDLIAFEEQVSEELKDLNIKPFKVLHFLAFCKKLLGSILPPLSPL